LQHTPSIQKVLLHSAADEQASPLSSFGSQLPARQYLPASHWTLSMQLPKQAFGPQLNGVQAAVFLELQAPPALHTERRVSVPSLQLAGMHSVLPPG
jgi:hypothetical protein